MSTLIYTHSACFEHRPGPHHPESPERLQAVLEALKAPEFAAAHWRDAPMGTFEQVRLVHTPHYVEWVRSRSPSEGYAALDGGDTIMSPGTLEAVLRCVGAACAGVDAVLANEADNVFCATRPCGHHAEADRAMGFCVFNQVAIAALHARHVHGVKRLAVVDFDVHHGNGTQSAFFDDPDLFYGSCHQFPFFPGTGSRQECGVANNIVNIPLSRACDSAMFRSHMVSEMLPALRRFEPELLIISAGFDAHQLDPLGGLRFTDDDYHWITQELMKVAEESAGRHVVSILEGGYSPEALASGVGAHVRALLGS